MRVSHRHDALSLHLCIHPESKDTAFNPHITLQVRKPTLIHHHPIYRLHSKFYNFHKNVLSSLLSWDPIKENAYHIDFFSSNLAVSQFLPIFLVLGSFKDTGHTFCRMTFILSDHPDSSAVLTWGKFVSQG